MITILDMGREGPQGPPGSVPYGFLQTSASSIWLLNHNLNRHPFSVRVIDDIGNELLCEHLDLDLNNTEIRFIVPVAGIAYVS